MKEKTMSQTGVSYAVDVVFCIDVTGSMAPSIAAVKAWALGFRDIIEGPLADAGKAISQLRVRVVAFRDRTYDGDGWLAGSPFFVLPDQDPEFSAYVNGLDADGGGPETESALEALGESINSDWETGFERRRHVIILFTDAPAYPLGTSTPATTLSGSPMPQTMEELEGQWGYSIDQTTGNPEAVMDYAAKRLIMFVPEREPWLTLPHDFENTYYEFTARGEGCSDVLPLVMEMLVGSV